MAMCFDLIKRIGRKETKNYLGRGDNIYILISNIQ